MLIAPSILSADFSKLGEEVKKLESAGADWIHIDVMDGNFVPNISIGTPVIKSIRKLSGLPFDVHLMIEKPELHYLQFVRAGADIITIHVESTRCLYRLVKEIKQHCMAGVALNPSTPLCAVENILDEIDLLLIMSVEPGFGGQKFIEGSLKKLEEARKMMGKRKIYLGVDGGINAENAGKVKRAGADVLVSGSYILKSKDYKEAIEKMRKA